MSQSESVSEPGLGNGVHALSLPDLSGAVPTSAEARAKRRIAALEEELQTMKDERGPKQRKMTYYVAQGRAVRRMTVLYTSLENLIAENDRRYEGSLVNDIAQNTTEQNRLQRGYLALTQTLPWLHAKLADCDYDESEEMLKKIRRGADAARGDDTSTLKDLVAAWINQDFRPTILLRSNDKHLRGFAHDVCGKLLCPTEWDWNDDRVKAGIHDRTTDFIVSENSWPLFVYQNYTFDDSNLEQGLFMSKILVQAFKAVFTSPSSAREADGDGDGADILENNRRARRALNQVKVKTCVRFALSSVSSWRTVDGNFDYEVFWNNIVDFFKDVPGPIARHRVTKLLEWWTRKIFGKNHREDLTPEVVSKMSVTTLAEQRKRLEESAFDSD
ncbi:hypothetical protein DEU56DRAFT_735776 [Suillus clintonianus]|uniref:uncharacterized protein n=1 Tax=Suillus clintonianus TaxID=1904413 RepID=UPI001B86FD90|nr:uncharacterized protein DEU56DRAFT_735776 [Suillus clintonianus]KAG2139275.1 hypothetical protein DEU56DRAFT_735776 [Suillus clintonianus]